MYIALAVDGVRILNKKFAIQVSTVFTNNGVVFTYVRSPESVSTVGPLSKPLTVQVNGTILIHFVIIYYVFTGSHWIIKRKIFLISELRDVW